MQPAGVTCPAGGLPRRIKGTHQMLCCCSICWRTCARSVSAVAIGAAGETTLIQQLANSRAGCADVRTPTPNKGWRVGPAEATASNGVAARHPYAAADVVTAWNKLTACSTLTLVMPSAIYVPAQRNIRRRPLQNTMYTLCLQLM